MCFLLKMKISKRLLESKQVVPCFLKLINEVSQGFIKFCILAKTFFIFSYQPAGCMFNLVWNPGRFLVPCFVVSYLCGSATVAVKEIHFLVRLCFVYKCVDKCALLQVWSYQVKSFLKCILIPVGTWSPCGPARPSRHPYSRSKFLQSHRFDHVDWQAWWDILTDIQNRFCISKYVDLLCMVNVWLK